jgi:CO/xanthine dehydrogenase FAD-binding subunit
VIASANIAMRLVVQQGTVEGEARVVLCRVCAGSVAPVPQRLTGVEGLLEATSPALLASDQVLLALRQLLDAEIRPISDVRGSDWYKRRVVELALVEFLESVAGHYGQEV